MPRSSPQQAQRVPVCGAGGSRANVADWDRCQAQERAATKGAGSREITRRRGYPRDFAARGQQPAKPKFAAAERRESGRIRSDQERRTSQPAGEAKQLPCRRCGEYTGKSSRNASPRFRPFFQPGSRGATCLPAMLEATPVSTNAGPCILQSGRPLVRQQANPAAAQSAGSHRHSWRPGLPDPA